MKQLVSMSADVDGHPELPIAGQRDQQRAERPGVIVAEPVELQLPLLLRQLADQVFGFGRIGHRVLLLVVGLGSP